MPRLNRRDFVGSVVASAAASQLVSLPGAAAAADEPRRTATDLVALGRSGVKVSRVGLGTGVRGWNRQSNATRMGAEKFVALMKAAYDRGITFFDVADLYGTHGMVRQLLQDISRDKVQIQSKIWWMPQGVPERVTNATEAVERFLKEIGTDHLDSVLLHCTSDDNWTEKLATFMEQLEDCKKRGLIRSHGTSCHSFGALRASAASPWVDVQLARVNHRGPKMDGKPADIAAHLKSMREAGKGVIGMKIYGEGELRAKEDREASLRFVIEQQCIDAMIIGLESVEHIDETMANLQRILGG